jgi:hypothetical protein
MLPADLARLHKYLLEIEHSDHISDETRRGRKRVAGTQAAAEKAAALTTAIAGECLMSKRPSPASRSRQPRLRSTTRPRRAWGIPHWCSYASFDC